MSIQACAEIVFRGDPDRFRATMAAPLAGREKLFPLYAMNVEVARAPWVTQEAMIAEMRLQWWRDVLAEIASGGPVRRHEVATPLADVMSREMAEDLDDLVVARRWDIYRDPFDDLTAFQQHIGATSETLMWAAARLLGPAKESVVRDFAYAAGVANWLQAVPELEAKGRIPLVDGRPEAVRNLAQSALDRLLRAQRARKDVSAAATPALWSGWTAKAVLTQAVKDPLSVANGALGSSEARKRLSLLIKSTFGRW